MAYVKIYLVMDKSSYAPKEVGSNKQRIRRREVRRRVHIIWLKKDEIYGII